MTSYTAIEAARELGVSEKTIRRWIEDKKLQASKTARGMFAIPESELARVRLQREQDGEQDQASRLEDLEKKYSDLERQYNNLVERVAALEDQAASRTSAIYTPASGRAGKTRQPGAAPASLELFSTIRVPPEIPDGSILYTDFAQQHGMNPHTFRDHLVVGTGRGLEIKDKVAHLERPIPNRTEVERWLSPEQQYQAILYWQRHGKRYIPCPQCPHKPEQVSVTSETTLLDGDSAAIAERDE